MKHSRIAIIGAGMAGLALAWHLKQITSQHFDIDLFDHKSIGKGTSGIAAGLLHSFSGERSRKNKFADAGMTATMTLLREASEKLGKPVAAHTGMLRLAMTESQRLDFFESATRNPELKWWTSDQCSSIVPGITSKGGLWISSAISVHTQQYLEGLFQCCAFLGVHYEQCKINHLSELNGYDTVVVAAGPETAGFPELNHLSLNLLRGQLLELSWPSDLPPLPFILNSKVYIVMNPSNKTCIVGATFERDNLSQYACLETAISLLLPEAILMIPRLKESKVIACHAGLRVGTPDRLPFCQQISPKLWVYSGLGSKGLLYHALFAKKLAHAIAEK